MAQSKTEIAVADKLAARLMLTLGGRKFRQMRHRYQKNPAKGIEQLVNSAHIRAMAGQIYSDTGRAMGPDLFMRVVRTMAERSLTPEWNERDGKKSGISDALIEAVLAEAGLPVRRADTKGGWGVEGVWHLGPSKDMNASGQLFLIIDFDRGYGRFYLDRRHLDAHGQLTDEDEILGDGLELPDAIKRAQEILDR